MAAEEIRVLVVDDSAVIRSLIADSIAATPGMKVVGTAEDGLKALEILDSSRPDVITLDVQMPRMDGLATLDAILARRSIPVIMVSSLTRLGAEIALDALDRGAVDYLAKPDYGEKTRTAIRGRIAAEDPHGGRLRRAANPGNPPRATQANRPARGPAGNRAAGGKAGPGLGGGTADERRSDNPPTALPPELAGKCVAIGISTGGPPALAQLFAAIRPPMPPIVVVQHMPPNFTKPLAWRLDSLSDLSVKEAAVGDVSGAQPGPDRPRRQASASSPRGRCGEGRDPRRAGRQRPQAVGRRDDEQRRRGLRQRLPGRDHDRHGPRRGRRPAGPIRAAGGIMLGQDEATSDVYGMNKVAFVEGNVDRQFALDEAATVIAYHVRKLRPAAACR